MWQPYTTWTTSDKYWQFTLYVSDTHVTLKQGQSFQTWYALVDLKQDYYHAKFERPPLKYVKKTM